jgi:SAM-dependent methyltransferase
MSSAPFVRAGCQVVGIEPNSAMRRVAERTLANQGGFSIQDGVAEASGLPDRFADLIVVGRALHWFPQAAARAEFARISKPGGWLAVMSVSYVDEALEDAWRSLHRAEYGWDVEAGKHNRKVEPLHFFFAESNYRKLRGVQIVHEGWDQFFGRLLTMSTAPGPQSRYFACFEAQARAMFDRFRQDDELVFQTKTEIVFGHPAPN